MPALLLAEAPQTEAPHDAVWPWTPTGVTRWAAELLDRVERGELAAPDAELGRIASWLRVQAVGRDAIRIIEPRIARYAGTWAAAARQAGILDVVLIGADGASSPVPTGPATAAPALTGASAPMDLGWRYQAAVWILDRAEALARSAIRAVQR